MSDVLQYQALLIFGISTIFGVALYLLKSHIVQLVATSSAGAAPVAVVKALEERVSAQELRLAAVEVAMRHQPTGDQVHLLAVSIADLRGEMRALAASVGGLEKTLVSTARRVEMIDEHLTKRAS